MYTDSGCDEGAAVPADDDDDNGHGDDGHHGGDDDDDGDMICVALRLIRSAQSSITPLQGFRGAN